MSVQTVFWGWLAAVAGVAATAAAGVDVRAEANAMDASFAFKSVGLPANNDAATAARFVLVDGAADRASAPLDALHDGRVQAAEDDPSRSFFFQAGSDGGRLLIDLGRVVAVREFRSYSWHAGARGPQVYALYGSDGKALAFKPEPKRGVDPRTCGWRFVARVDTRTRDDDGGGQHGVSVRAGSGGLGDFRYLLMDCSRTENRDPFGNTFFGEIDVIAADGPAPTSGVVALPRIQERFVATNGARRCAFTVDATAAPDLAEWAATRLKPLLLTWSGRLEELLPSDGYHGPERITLCFRTDMGGTPASAGGGGVNLNADWFRKERDREAPGAVVHELVHLVQNYGLAKRTNPKPSATPGWVVEGIADYVRWFLFEPETGGAAITPQSFARARYDASYRVSANFLEWATRTCDKDLVRKLNAAAREGRYSDALWQEWTGKPLEALGEAWRREHAERLGLAL